MCKIMVITNIKDSTRDKALDFIKEMAPAYRDWETDRKSVV